MTGQFRLSPEFSLRIEPAAQAQGVLVILYRGVCYDHHLGDSTCKEITTQEIFLHKGHARAIASMIMSCASEAHSSGIQDIQVNNAVFTPPAVQPSLLAEPQRIGLGSQVER